MSELTNSPVPVPSVVVKSEVVGVPEVFQQTPRVVTVPPPSAVTFPPVEAELKVINEADVVVTVATSLPRPIV